MHAVDLVDETFIAVANTVLAEVVADPGRWAQWWPQRTMEVYLDRGAKGQRWAVAGDLVGSAEIWLEAYRDGVVLHYYLRADPAGGTRSNRDADRVRRQEATAWKRTVWMLKRELEHGRSPGEPAAGH